MKPKRTILAFDEPRHLSWLAVVLRTHGFLVVTCEDETQRREAAGRAWVDLLLIGPRIETKLVGEGILLRHPDWSISELLERVRIALVRKRGPKKAAVNSLPRDEKGQWAAEGKAVG